MRYFSYDHEGDGLVLHATAEEAQEAATTALDVARDEAPDGWSENVESICWGQLTEKVVETERYPWCEHLGCDDDCDGNHEFDEFVDYDLQPVAKDGE